MINKSKLVAASLTVVFALMFAFPLLALAATENETQNPPCYEKIIDRIAQEKGISKEEAESRLEAKLSEIAKQRGVTVEELKKQIAQGKFRKGRQMPLDEAKIKEIAEKRGISVEELKKQIAEGKFKRDYCGQLSEEKLKEIAEKRGITVEELKQKMNKYNWDKAEALQ